VQHEQHEQHEQYEQHEQRRKHGHAGRGTGRGRGAHPFVGRRGLRHRRRRRGRGRGRLSRGSHSGHGDQRGRAEFGHPHGPGRVFVGRQLQRAGLAHGAEEGRFGVRLWAGRGGQPAAVRQPPVRRGTGRRPDQGGAQAVAHDS